MLLRFNSQASLTSALATGAIPHVVAVQPVWWATAPDDAVIVETAFAFSQENLEQLAMLKVKGSKGNRTQSDAWHPAKCWLQVVPLVRDRDQELTPQTPVIFESSTLEGAAELALEMLRLGNDRQGLLSLETESVEGAAGPRYFLRALGPSYYTMLRSAEAGSEVRGFIERRPRVFVEAGWTHPLIDRLTAPPGEQWFLAAERSWRQLPEIPFRDLYEVAEFVLPGGVQHATSQPTDRFAVPISLAAGSTDQPAEMWVLKQDALTQVQQFVETAAEEVIARLSFAVVEPASGTTWVVLRMRPGQGVPPTLVFDGMPFVPVQRLAGIMVPLGKRIFPPIRRDAIQKLLAPGDGNTLWLDVDEGGTLQRRILADAAFRPLREFVNYTIDAVASHMKAWFESATFDFAEFVCREDQATTGDPKRQAAATKPATPSKPILQPGTPAKADGPRDVVDEMIQAFPAKPAKPPRPDELAAIREEAQKLEVAFVSDPSPLDASHRLPQWTQMAELQRVLKRHREAILCYLHRSWEDQSASANEMRVWSAIVRDASGKGGKTGLIDDRGLTTAHQLDETLSVAKPSPLQVEQLAAWLAWQAASGQTPAIVTERMGRVTAYLEKWDRLISVRAAWLAQMALAKISGGDALLVARARDRILERIFSHGIDPDIELPAFLWDVHSGERLVELRARTFQLCETVQDWSVRNLGAASRATSAYIDYAFAFVLAKLGEADHAQKLKERADRMIESQHDREGLVHFWLSEAFRLRIRQALERRETVGPLPDKMLAELPGLDANSRYKIDRMRDRSRILQPLERLYPYRHFWLPVASTPVIKQVEALADYSSPTELQKAAESLLHRRDFGDTGCRVTAKLLELTPRLGERFLLQVLPNVGPLLAGNSQPALRIAVAEKAIVAAGHFGHVEFARDTANKLTHLLDELATKPVDVKTLEALATMIGAWFRNLRRLGLHRDLATILPKLAALAMPSGLDRGMPTSLEGLRLVLAVAGAEMSMIRGNSRDHVDDSAGERAREVIANVRAILHRRPFDAQGSGHAGSMMQSQLASAYVTAVGTLPLEEMWTLYGDLFSFLSGVEDNSSMALAVAMKQYDIVDALATTLLTDDFQRDDTARRWMEEEEFLIRRRIHHDLRAAEAGASESKASGS
jgi:hypothetical protein